MREFGVENVTIYKAIKAIFQLIYEGDIVVFAGPQLCEEAYEQNDRMGNIYLYDYDTAVQALSMGLGILMTSNKRVFIICDDYVMLRSINQLLQCGASRHADLYVGLILSETLHYSDYFPSIAANFGNGRTFFCGLGFDSYTLNIDIGVDRHKDSLETIKETFYRLKGPIGFSIFVTNIKRNLDFKEEIHKINCKDRVKVILDDDELVLPEFVPPFEMGALSEEYALDNPNAIQELGDIVLPGGF